MGFGDGIWGFELGNGIWVLDWRWDLKMKKKNTR